MEASQLYAHLDFREKVEKQHQVSEKETSMWAFGSSKSPSNKLNLFTSTTSRFVSLFHREEIPLPQHLVTFEIRSYSFAFIDYDNFGN